MTTTAPEPKRRRSRTAPTEKEEGAAPVDAAVLPPTKTRRRPGLIAGGAALVIVGALGSWFYASQAGDTVTVLVASGDIARGDTIAKEDLSTLQIAGGQETTALRAEQSAEVLGKIATLDIPAGSLISTSTIDTALTVEDGQSVVGFALTQSQIPSVPLNAGDKVRIVDTPVQQGDPPADTPNSLRGTVFTVTQSADDAGQWLVNLIVPSSEAADLAARAATGRAALVLDGGQ